MAKNKIEEKISEKYVETAKEVAGKAIGKHGLIYITVIVAMGVGASIVLEEGKMAAVMGLLGASLTALISMLNGVAGATPKQDKPEFEIMKQLIERLDRMADRDPVSVAVDKDKVLVQKGENQTAIGNNMFPLTALFDVGMKVFSKFIPDPEAKAKAQQELLKMQQEGRLAELNADNIEAQELTKRQAADMASDSWLSKNIRPMTLIFILAAYFVFAMMSAFDNNANEKYVELLGQWGMLIMSFYFGGRTLEKIMDMKAKKDATK